MGKTTEVTAQSRNCGSRLERTLGSSQGRATPESSTAEIGLHPGRKGEALEESWAGKPEKEQRRLGDV